MLASFSHIAMRQIRDGGKHSEAAQRALNQLDSLYVDAVRDPKAAAVMRRLLVAFVLLSRPMAAYRRQARGLGRRARKKFTDEELLRALQRANGISDTAARLHSDRKTVARRIQALLEMGHERNVPIAALQSLRRSQALREKRGKA
jgi:hypothetical protein